jgi:RNA polymerase sigma-70 factor, ECF subfamily
MSLDMDGLFRSPSQHLFVESAGRKDTRSVDVSFWRPFFVPLLNWLTPTLAPETIRSMEHPTQDGTMNLQASIDVTRKQFLVAVKGVRPRLHRFCARMCGSVLDGEDVVQETLADAFFRLPSLRDPSRLEPWLFRMAHNKCIDFLRRDKRNREDTVSYAPEHDEGVTPAELSPADEPIDEALAALVGELPPKERAAVLLKDVLDYSLADVADVVDSTVGGVKAALHRGRTKLRALHRAPTQSALDREQRALLDAYIECFNRQDWTALRQLIRVDARLEIVGASQGTMLDVGANYFTNYTRLPWEWKLSLARVDGAGEPFIVHFRRVDGAWQPVTAVRLWWDDGKVVAIKDYVHVEYLLQHSRTELATDIR